MTRMLFDDPLPIVNAPTSGVSEPITKAPSTSSQVLAPTNPGRGGGVLTTTSSLPIFVRFGADASTSLGGFHLLLTAAAPIVIPNGVTASISIIAAGVATGAIAFTEWLK